MRIKKYRNFINEDLKSDIESLLQDENKDLKSEIVDKIIKSLKTDERDVFDEFVDAYIRDDEKNQIEGLINDSDVYEFYLSYRNEIDALLAEINFYDEAPSDPELNCFSLYDYIVKGTMKAVKECVSLIKEESSKSQSQSQTKPQGQSQGQPQSQVQSSQI